jgi:PEGA domain-containing protein
VTRTQSVIVVAVATLTAQLALPANAHAQRGRGGRRGGAIIVAAVPYYSPFYGPWFYDSWYPYPFGYPYPPYAYGARYPFASLRVQVQPSQTEVFVDGYYAGTTDDFDGFFQRLRLEPGEHEIELYLQGYRSTRQKIYLQPDSTFRVRHTMQPLQPGESPDERPIPTGVLPAQRTSGPAGQPGPGPSLPVPGERPRGLNGTGAAPSTFGALALRTQPADADVLVDGQPWQSSGSGNQLIVQLPPGEHRVEVRKSGFQTFSTVVQVRRGETTALNVSLVQD